MCSGERLRSLSLLTESFATLCLPLTDLTEDENHLSENLKEDDIQNLILDLRINEGGSEHHQMELMAYLYHQPFKLYQNIYLSQLGFRPLKSIVLA